MDWDSYLLQNQEVRLLVIEVLYTNSESKATWLWALQPFSSVWSKEWLNPCLTAAWLALKGNNLRCAATEGPLKWSKYKHKSKFIIEEKESSQTFAISQWTATFKPTRVYRLCMNILRITQIVLAVGRVVFSYLTHTSITTCLRSRLIFNPVLQMKILRYMGLCHLPKIVLMVK